MGLLLRMLAKDPLGALRESSGDSLSPAYEAAFEAISIENDVQNALMLEIDQKGLDDAVRGVHGEVVKLIGQTTTCFSPVVSSAAEALGSMTRRSSVTMTWVSESATWRSTSSAT